MKSKYSTAEWEEIIAEYKRTHAVKEISEKYGISKSTLYEWCTKLIHIKRKYSKQQYKNTDIYRMERKMRSLEQENNIFKDSGCGTESSIDEKFEAVNKLKDKYSVSDICKTLQLSKATYYNRILRAPVVKQHDVEDEQFSTLIKEYFEMSKQRFGPIKIHALLKKDGHCISRARVTRLMKEMELIPKLSLRPLPHAHKNYKYRVNRLRRIFDQSAPNKTWVSDITYVFVGNKMYAITVIIDLFSRKIIAHMVSLYTPASLIVRLFDNAFRERGNPQCLTFHSDQGTQYTSYQFRHHLKNLNVTQSFSNPGCPVDNAVAEGFFSCMKREEIAHNVYNTAEELKKVVDDYINFYNNVRPHRKLGNIPPAEYELKFTENTDEPDFIPY